MPPFGTLKRRFASHLSANRTHNGLPHNLAAASPNALAPGLALLRRLGPAVPKVWGVATDATAERAEAPGTPGQAASPGAGRVLLARSPVAYVPVARARVARVRVARVRVVPHEVVPVQAVLPRVAAPTKAAQDLLRKDLGPRGKMPARRKNGPRGHLPTRDSTQPSPKPLPRLPQDAMSGQD